MVGESRVTRELCRNCTARSPRSNEQISEQSRMRTPGDPPPLKLRKGKGVFFMAECEPVKQFESSVEQDVNDIKPLQIAFNKATKIHVKEDTFLNRSYNPVFDRWRIQRAWATGNSAKVEEEIQHTRENIHTNLKERMLAVETEGMFELRDGKLYSELLPDESFGQVILRGANIRASHGSLEQEREGIKGELGGWLELTKALTIGEVGTRVISLSPKGRIPKTSYDGNYVDIYEKTGPNAVKRTRISVNFTDADYLAVATSFDPHFEAKQKQDGRALDAWYLSHPFVLSDRSMPLPHLLRSTTAMPTKEFDALYAKMKQTGLIDYYMHVLTRPQIDWRVLAKAFNTILNVADKIKNNEDMSQIEERTVRRGMEYTYDELKMSRAMALVSALGTQHVKEIGGGGCPPNRGFDLDDPAGQFSNAAKIQELLDNSAGKFAWETPEMWTYHDGECVVCHKKNQKVGPCEICRDCEKKF